MGSPGWVRSRAWIWLFSSMPMRLQAVLLPDAVHRALVNPLFLCHRPGAPVSLAIRLALQSGFDHPLRQTGLGLASPPLRHFPQALRPLGDKSLPPEPARVPIHPELLSALCLKCRRMIAAGSFRHESPSFRAISSLGLDGVITYPGVLRSGSSSVAALADEVFVHAASRALAPAMGDGKGTG